MEESYVLHLQNQYQKFSDFYLCYCGHARCAPLHSYGPAVRRSAPTTCCTTSWRAGEPIMWRAGTTPWGRGRAF